MDLVKEFLIPFAPCDCDARYVESFKTSKDTFAKTTTEVKQVASKVIVSLSTPKV